MFKLLVIAAVVMGLGYYARTKTTEVLPVDIPEPWTRGKNISDRELPESRKDDTERLPAVVKRIKPEAEDKECEEVSRPRGMSLLSGGGQTSGMDTPAKWVAHNNSSATVAIVLAQEGKPVAVVFMGPYQKYEAQIPSRGVYLQARYSSNTCINWKKASVGNGGFLPDAKKMDKAEFSAKRQPLFASAITPEGSGIQMTTKFIRHARVQMQ